MDCQAKSHQLSATLDFPLSMQKCLNLTENLLLFVSLILAPHSGGLLIVATNRQWKFMKGDRNHLQPGYRFLLAHHVETPVLELALHQNSLVTSDFWEPERLTQCLVSMCLRRTAATPFFSSCPLCMLEKYISTLSQKARPNRSFLTYGLYGQNGHLKAHREMA